MERGDSLWVRVDGKWIAATYEFRVEQAEPLGAHSVMRADGGGRVVVYPNDTHIGPLAPVLPATRLVDALTQREKQYRSAIDRIRELSSGETENEVYELTTLLREAVEMAGCLRRLVPERSVAELHKAFGAPGDFGYETPIGDALYRIYRGGP